MIRHRNTSQLLLLFMFFLSINLYAQEEQQNADKVYDVSITSKGQGSIICNEQYRVGNDDRKEFTLKNNADVRLKFAPQKGYKLTKLTINGIIKGQDIENNQITIKGISRRTSIVATFESVEDSVKLTLISGEGGTLYYNNGSIINSNKTTTVKKGSQINLKIDPQKGFKLEKLSINGILRDVADNTCSFEIRRNSVVKVAFSAITPAILNNQTEQKLKFIINVCGPGEVALSGEINGVVAGNPEDPLRRNREEFYVTNGSDVTMKLTPVQNIKSLTIGYKDLTQTVKSSNGTYTIGVMHDDPERGTTSVFIDFTQRYLVEISTNEYGNYKALDDLKESGIPNCYINEKGGKGRLRLIANEHCHLEKLTVNGMDMTNKVNPSSTVVTSGGPTYDFDLGSVEKDYKIVATFAPDPKLTIVCGQFGNADRALDTKAPIGYTHSLDPEYGVNSGQSKTFYEPSAARRSHFYGKEWILRMSAQEGYKLSKIVINGVDMTSRVIRYSPNSPRNNLETCFISLGFIKKDTRVEISFKKSIQQTQEVEWVDLGTGVKWATRNVGAKKSTDTGNFYTWKEAHALDVQLGRLPTHNEIMRLAEECCPKYTEENGVKGYKFYHRSNKSIYIFIPLAGFYSENEPNRLQEYNKGGAIWTSTQTGAAKKMSEAMKERTMNPIWLMIGDAFSSDGYDRSALTFSPYEERPVKTMDVDIGARLNVRLVLDK